MASPPPFPHSPGHHQKPPGHLRFEFPFGETHLEAAQGAGRLIDPCNANWGGVLQFISHFTSLASLLTHGLSAPSFLRLAPHLGKQNHPGLVCHSFHHGQSPLLPSCCIWAFCVLQGFSAGKQGGSRGSAHLGDLLIWGISSPWSRWLISF